MRLADTTNGQIGIVAAGVRQLIEWAEADAEHAAENGAPGTAKDDRRRARNLRKALALIEACQR